MLVDLRDRFRLALVTNSPRAHAALDDMGLTDHFDEVVEIPPDLRKPRPEGFWHAAERLGVEPADLVYVGDSYRCDIQAGLAAGVRPIWVDRWDTELPVPDGVMRITDLYALPAVAGLGSAPWRRSPPSPGRSTRPTSAPRSCTSTSSCSAPRSSRTTARATGTPRSASPTRVAKLNDLAGPGHPHDRRPDRHRPRPLPALGPAGGRAGRPADRRRHRPLHVQRRPLLLPLPGPALRHRPGPDGRRCS